MQNVESQKTLDTDKENLELAKASTSLGSSLTDIQTETTSKPQPEGVQSDTELRPKLKSRSRLSAAFRSFSTKSSKKKDSSVEKEPRSLPTELSVFSTGDEDRSESVKPKKKTKLTKRLFSLRKSKVSPKKSQDNKDENVVASSSQAITIDKSEQESCEPSTLSGDDETPSTSSSSPKKGESIRKVQITISGKKVEKSSSVKSGKQPTTESTAVSREADYLTPTTTTTTKDTRTTKVIVSKVGSTLKESPTTAVTVAAATAGASPPKAAALDPKKKKLKLKKVTTAIAATTRVTSSSNAQTQTQTKTTSNEEKIVITQSTSDTPPPERAPAKPSRVTATAAAIQTTSSTGAVRKSTTKAAAASAAKSSSSTTVTQSHSSGTSKKSLRTVATAAALVSSKKVKDLMQNPQQSSQQQRGHRFSRPTATATGTSPTTKTDIQIKQQQQQTIDTEPPIQQQIQFQLESHASQTHTLPPTPPEEEQQQQQPIEPIPQSNISNELLEPPTHQPPSIPANVIQETRSPPHRHPSAHSSAKTDSDNLKHITYESVDTASLSEADDEVVSSAESAQPSEYSGNNIQNPNVAGHFALSPQDNRSTPVVHFAVGSAVRPPPQKGAGSPLTVFEPIDPNSNDSNSDSLSATSESSRRRIHYVAQPTLKDDYDSVKGRRETLHYQSIVGSDALDSEEYDSSDKASSMPAFGDLTMDQEMEPTIMTSTSEKREHLYKILVIGELGTGKTSFIKRYVHQFFSQNYRATIGVDFALKVLHWDGNTIVRLQLWDIAGQERFGNMTRVYYKEAVGAFIVFDVTRSGTFDCVSKWKEDLDSKVQLPDGSPIPCILLANKCDQEKQGIVTTPEKMDEYVRENGFAGWFETSAKENINIDEAARALVNKILLNDKLISDADLTDADKVNLNSSGDQAATTETKNKCAC